MAMIPLHCSYPHIWEFPNNVDCFLIHLITLTTINSINRQLKGYRVFFWRKTKQNAEKILHCNCRQQGDFNCGASSQADSELFPLKFPLKFPQFSSIHLKFLLKFSISSQPGWHAWTVKATLTDSTPFCITNYPFISSFYLKILLMEWGLKKICFMMVSVWSDYNKNIRMSPCPLAPLRLRVFLEKTAAQKNWKVLSKEQNIEKHRQKIWVQGAGLYPILGVIFPNISILYKF